MTPIQHRLHEIIFEADTRAGKAFDVLLFIAIILSVVVVSLESVAELRQTYGMWFRVIEWCLTIAFTVEYALRLACVGKPRRYAVSFFGIVDLLAILPTYLSLFFVGTQTLIVIRAIRLLRIFRVFKLVHFVSEARVLKAAMQASLRKIVIFVGFVLTLVLILGTIMYMVEGPTHGFTSIPQGVYWAIVTMTTVGYGDVAPATVLGKTIASFAMILGYGIIAVPTGIVTMELGLATHRTVSTQACTQCSAEGHAPDAVFCKFCGAHL